MLELSFCLVGGLGLDAEQRLWRQGIVSWEDYRRQGERFFSPPRHRRILADIDAAETALRRHDIRFFLKHLPARARMRVWPLLGDCAAYLDVETTGLGPTDQITTAALYTAKEVRTFVDGQNLQELPRAIPKEAILVTYNGRRFDLPRLRLQLGCSFRQPHLDLCPVLRAAGYGPGGLKACERQLGVARRTMVGMTGADAVTLWGAYQQGDLAALERLLAYNVEDVLALERVLVAACNRSMNACPGYRPLASPQPPPFEPG